MSLTNLFFLSHQNNILDALNTQDVSISIFPYVLKLLLKNFVFCFDFHFFFSCIINKSNVLLLYFCNWVGTCCKVSELRFRRNGIHEDISTLTNSVKLSFNRNGKSMRMKDLKQFQRAKSLLFEWCSWW